jgi:DDE superfamily endonuclease
MNVTAKGWATADSFYDFIVNHWYPKAEIVKPGGPHIMTADGYAAHHSLKLYNWCIKHNVTFIIWPSNSTHIIQMCDTTMFSPIKAKYSEIYETWRSVNPSGLFDHIEFVKVLKLTNDAVIRPNMIINGFKMTGVCPWGIENLRLERIIGHPSRFPTATVTSTAAQICPIEVLNVETVNLDLSSLLEFQKHTSSNCDNSQVGEFSDYENSPAEFDYHQHSTELNDYENFGEQSIANVEIDFGEDSSDYVVATPQALITSGSPKINEKSFKKLLDKTLDGFKSLRPFVKAFNKSKVPDLMVIERLIKGLGEIPAERAVKATTVKELLKIDERAKFSRVSAPKFKKSGVMSCMTLVSNIEYNQQQEGDSKTEAEQFMEERLLREMEIAEADAKLLEHRENLKTLKAEHIGKNRGASIKKKSNVENNKNLRRNIFSPRANNHVEEVNAVIEPENAEDSIINTIESPMPSPLLKRPNSQETKAMSENLPKKRKVDGKSKKSSKPVRDKTSMICPRIYDFRKNQCIKKEKP